MRPGENCWRVCRADDAALLIDAEAYFRNLYINLQHARHSIYILGWDIDSRISLLQGEKTKRDPSPRLEEFLTTLLQRRPTLRIYILTWDFSPVFIFDRELFQALKFRMGADARLRFHFDHQHPFTASQHQKVVVMDDRLAWSGGLDLTAARWDTTKHGAHDTRRCFGNGKPYPPHHDVQMMVTGEAAAALGELCRHRWHMATGERLAAPPATPPKPYAFPQDKFTNVSVGIARTFPTFQGEREVREVEKLYVDSIRAAKRFIYLENQYFTADSISRALAESLQKPEGPDIVVVIPIDQVGVLAKIAMRNLSLKIAHKLKAIDTYRRFHVYSPIDENLPKPWFRNIHSKVAIFDFAYLRVGSANLNNRSMGLDSECDLMIDASHSPADQERIARLFAELVAEHAPLAAPDVLAHLHRGTLIQAIQDQAKNRTGPVYLLPHVQQAPGLVSDVVEKLEIFDLHKSTRVERLLDRVFFSITKGHRPVLRNLPLGFSLTLLYSLVMAVVVVFRPVQPVLPSFMDQEGFWLSVGALTLILAPLNFGLVSFASFLPLIPAAEIGIMWGTGAACVGYLIGRLLPRAFVTRTCKTSLHLLSQRIARYRVIDIFLLRFFPLAPFASVNLAAGFLRLSFKRYLVGTFLGILPGALALASFQRTLIHALKSPTLPNLLMFLGLLVLITLIYERLQNRFINSPRENHEGVA